NELQRRCRIGGDAPKELVHRKIAEPHTEFGHAFLVKLEMVLFFPHGADHAAAKSRRGVGKLKEAMRHQLQSEELVVGEVMQDETALPITLQSPRCRERAGRFAGGRASGKGEFLWPPRLV